MTTARRSSPSAPGIRSWRVGLVLLGLVLLGLLATPGCPGDVNPANLADGSSDRLAVDSAPDQAARDLSPDRGGDQAVDAADAALDAPRPDAAACVSQPDQDTVALYTFEGSGNSVPDALGNNPGQIVGPGVSRVTSHDGCGQAIAFAVGAADSYVEIPDAPAWALSEGSVDLWVRFDKVSGVVSRGILSRDASGTAKPGHFNLSRDCDGAIVIRHQRADVSHYQCSEPVAEESWIHVGVNFGPAGLELYVDGKRASRTDAAKSISSGKCVDSATNRCGTPSTGGIEGNNNPWVVGAASSTSEEGLATPVTSPLGGAVDSLRISSARRSF